MNKLSGIITSFKDNYLVDARRLFSKIKRKTKRKVTHLKEASYLNFRNIKSHKKALKRYKRKALVNSVKKNKKNITRAYNTFSQAIIILIITWTFLNTLSIYHNQRDSFKNKVEIQRAIIEKNFSNSISLIENFSSYVGDKILLFGVDDKKAIATILKKNNSTDSITRNIYSWLDVDYVGNSKKLLVTSKNGVLPKAKKVPDYYPIDESLERKWVFKVGKVSLIKSDYGDYQIIPTAFSIDDDDYSPRGTLISRIILQQVDDNIKRGIEDEDVSYIVLSKDSNLIAYSANDVILDDNKKKQLIRQKLSENKELKELFKESDKYRFGDKNGKLKEPINIGNTTYRDYRKSDYPFIILVSYSKNVIWNEFRKEFSYLLFQSGAITMLFLSALFIFKRIQIVPIIKQLVNSREKAEEASKAKSNFLSTISHELRTPMNGIIGMSQILSESRNLNDEEWDQVKTIHKSADALLLILNDILNFSKIEAQKVELEKIDFNLHLLLENTIDIMSPAASKKSLEIFMHIDEAIPRILIGDPGRLRQIITNLINNAIKFTAKGQIFVEVILEKSFRNKYTLRFNIKDSGIGIRKTDLRNLFRKFTQADMSTTRKYGGTGLGLSICKELVRLMGGKINISSEVNKGSNFWFTIPLLKSNEEVGPLKIKERAKISGKQVAILDSNAIGRRILESRINNLFQIKVNSLDLDNLSDSIKKDPDFITNYLSNEKYSAVLINNSTGNNFSGVEVAKQIKKVDKLSNIPLILIISSDLKGKLLDEDIELFSSIITKPIKESIFIDSMLDAHKIIYKKDKRSLSSDTKTRKVAKVATRPHRILMCEDNKINMKVAQAVLSRMGLDIDIAQNGKEGLDIILSEKTQYDLVFMDCMMPVMDGFTATKKIRAIEKKNKKKPIPIIALTANISDSDRDKCFKAGMNDFLSKPIQKDRIEEVLKKWAKK